MVRSEKKKLEDHHDDYILSSYIKSEEVNLNYNIRSDILLNKICLLVLFFFFFF